MDLFSFSSSTSAAVATLYVPMKNLAIYSVVQQERERTREYDESLQLLAKLAQQGITDLNTEIDAINELNEQFAEPIQIHTDRDWLEYPYLD